MHCPEFEAVWNLNQNGTSMLKLFCSCLPDLICPNIVCWGYRYLFYRTGIRLMEMKLMRQNGDDADNNDDAANLFPRRYDGTFLLPICIHSKWIRCVMGPNQARKVSNRDHRERGWSAAILEGVVAYGGPDNTKECSCIRNGFSSRSTRARIYAPMLMMYESYVG